MCNCAICKLDFAKLCIMKTSKLFIGPKIREIRGASNLTQAKFAQALGISTSYLNQLENNQRHASASVLMALAQNFSVDIRTLSDQDSERLLANILEISGDDLFANHDLSNRDLKLAVKNTPNFVKAFLTLHKSTQNLKEHLAELDHHGAGTKVSLTPYEEVRDFFHFTDNYIDSLDRAGENFVEQMGGDDQPLQDRLSQHLLTQHGIQTSSGGRAYHPNALRHYDPATKTLHLNPHSRSATQAFHMAHHIALLEHSETIEKIAKDAGFRSQEAVEICKIGLANYFAGSVLLPYQRFIEAAKLHRHDLQILSDEFGASLEQICHRLSTLQRPGQKGIPFFFARMDQSGNIPKRHSATKLQFARYGSACPIWNVHQAFEMSGRIIRQLAETPDGQKYLCIATAINISSGGFRDPVRRFALALGCETKYMDNIVYGDDLNPSAQDSYDPIGISCRICERKNCHQRSVPPLRSQLKIQPFIRNVVPYEL